MTLAYLSALLRHPVTDKNGTPLGRLTDVIIQLDGNTHPDVTAVVVRLTHAGVFVPAADIATLTGGRVALASTRVDVRPFARRPGEVLLKRDVLGHRVVDLAHARLARAADVLIDDDDGIRAVGLDVHHRRLLHPAPPAARDWDDFNVLLGHEATLALRRRTSRLRTLRPAQVADLIEDASGPERADLLADVGADPDFEADVLEELTDDDTARVLRTRDTPAIAAALSHMQPDDAADTLIALPHERRQAVLDAIAEPQHAAILALLAYQGHTAGGIMSVDQFVLPSTTTAAGALAAIRNDRDRQPQAMAVIMTTGLDGRLDGTVPLPRLIQADPSSTLAQIREPDPVSCAPTEDAADAIIRMADFNLLILPVTDVDGRILGAVTVDDALGTAIPHQWRAREQPDDDDA